MRVVIVTGMSGAGKSTALKMLEDAGYFCVDNLPIPLLPTLSELLRDQNAEVNKVALGIDVRGRYTFEEIENVLQDVQARGFRSEILFLDADDEVLIRRYKETRRNHPLAGEGRLNEGIEKERRAIEVFREKANYILDTSQMLTRELKVEIDKIFVKNKVFQNLYVTVLSFGFKYGIPNDADLVFDVRFLPNPYYIETLRSKTGNDKEVRDFVMQNQNAGIFLDKLEEMVSFLLPNYVAEGKNQLVVAIGCTGGKHRSVTLANALYERLSRQEGFGIKIEHRDSEKDAKRKK